MPFKFLWIRDNHVNLFRWLLGRTGGNPNAYLTIIPRGFGIQIGRIKNRCYSTGITFRQHDSAFVQILRLPPRHFVRISWYKSIRRQSRYEQAELHSKDSQGSEDHEVVLYVIPQGILASIKQSKSSDPAKQKAVVQQDNSSLWELSAVVAGNWKLRLLVDDTVMRSLNRITIKRSEKATMTLSMNTLLVSFCLRVSEW